jgi:uncharacterized protein (DUF433 family)
MPLSWAAEVTEAGLAPIGRRAYLPWLRSRFPCRQLPSSLARRTPAGWPVTRAAETLNRMSGLPCIRDTWVTVSAVLGQFAAALSIPELLVDFPYLDRADVLAALEFAAAAVQERELPLARWA